MDVSVDGVFHSNTQKIGTATGIDFRKFPSNFKFRVTTAAYQIESAGNKNGRGENIWHNLTHTTHDLAYDNSNGDIACDSYHKFEESLAPLKDLLSDS
jgi:beta-glucosidase/6-phospho-beta-glucosidase/beta-galactosidase